MPIVKGFDFKTVESFFAFDPGGTTGFAHCKVDRSTNTLIVVEHSEFPNWTRLESLLARKKEGHVVVYETFTNLTTDANLIPVEVIGVLKYLTNKKGIFRFPQKPNERKCIEKIYPAVMQKISSHSGDAVKHAIYFAVFRLGMINCKIDIACKRKRKLPRC